MKGIFTFSIAAILSFFQSYSQCSAVYTAPFSENFNSPTWGPASGDCLYLLYWPGSINSCWQRNSTYYSMVVGPVNDYTCGTYGPYPKEGGNGKYIRPFLDYNQTSINNTAWIISPKIDISSLANPEVEIWYYKGGHYHDVYIQARGVGSTNWVNLDTIEQVSQTTDSLWLSNFTKIPVLSSDTIEVKIIADYAPSNRLLAMDDFKIIEGSFCPRVSGVTVTATSDTSVTLDWAGGNGGWQVEYGEGLVYPGDSSNTIVSVNGKPAMISGLMPNTQYTFYVRDSCGTASPAQWSNPVIETTECSALIAPFLETFDGPDFMHNVGYSALERFNDCYQRISNNQNYGWHVHDSLSSTYILNTGPALDHTSGKGNYLSTSMSGASAIAELYTPMIDISNLQSPILTFWVYMYGTDIKEFRVSAVGDQFDIELDSVFGEQQTSKTDAWIRRDIRLDSLPSNIFKLRFTGATKSNAYIYGRVAIDDLQVNEEQVCSGPYDVKTDWLSKNTARISWKDTTSSHWYIEYGSQGFTPGQGVLDSILYSKHFAFAGLSKATTYDYYLLGVCGTIDSSAIKGPFSFTTTCDSVFAGFNDSISMLDITLDAGMSFGNDLSYQWIFGDGSVGTGQSVFHTYSNGGVYTVTLVVQDSCSQVQIAQRRIEVCDSLFVGFTDSISLLDVSLDAGLSAGSYLTYHWGFGDGTIGTGKTISHSYASGGAYTVTLVVQDTCSQIEVTQRIIDVCDSLEAAFTYSIIDTVVTFMAQTAPGISKYYWDFGDGTQDSGAVVQHAYDLAASSPPFDVKLRVMNNCEKLDSVVETLPSDFNVNEHVLKDIIIYPNPTSSEVFVVVPWLSTQKVEVALFDISGQIFKPEYSTSSNILRMELTDYTSGQYLLRIKLEQTEISKKIIIAK